jgi:uncharacterized membrane protein YcaP (DUF421 family)
MDGMAQWFELTVSPWELIVRGTVMYLGLIAMFRFVLRRDVGSMNMADVLFIVIIADASQGAMSGESKSIGDGAVLVATLIGWNMCLDWLAYYSPTLRRVIAPPALPLIENGSWLRRNLQREWITTDEILSKLREHGIDDISLVRKAFLEPSGELGVIRNDRTDQE